MNNEFQQLNNGEILSLNHNDVGRKLNLSSHGFADLQIKVEHFTQVITRQLNLQDTQGQSIFEQGINCQALKFSSSRWQKGRLRAKVVLEFCPDESLVEEKPLTNEPELSEDGYWSNDEIEKI